MRRIRINRGLWSSDICATSSPWPKSGTSAALPHGFTSRSHRSRNRSAASRPSSENPLLYRTTRSVELAPAGEVLLDRAREILAAVDSAIDDARRAARGEFGRLAIGFTGSVTYAILPSLAAALRHQLPGVTLDLRGELLTPAQVTQLRNGTLDLGLLRPPVHERDLSTEVLRSEPLVAVLPETHPLANSELGPTRTAQRRTVHHLSVPLPIRPTRRRRGRLRGARLQTPRLSRSRRDRDARELRRRRTRRLARSGVSTQHDRTGRDLPPARQRHHSGRTRRGVET